MKDPRIDTLAKNLVRHSISARAGEKVLIQANNMAPELVRALVREVYAVGSNRRTDESPSRNRTL